MAALKVVVSLLVVVLLGLLATLWLEQQPTPRQQAPTSCVIYQAREGVSVAVTGVGPDPTCASLASSWSGPNAYWQVLQCRDGCNYHDARIICDLWQGGYEYIVRDTGGAVIGTSLCGQLVHAGFTAH